MSLSTSNLVMNTLKFVVTLQYYIFIFGILSLIKKTAMLVCKNSNLLYLGSDTAIEIPIARSERKIEALMVIFERSGRTICLKSNFIVTYGQTKFCFIYLYLSYAIRTTEKDEKDAKAVCVHPFSLHRISY